MSAADIPCLQQIPAVASNFRYGGPIRLFSRKKRPILILMAQFQTCAVFSYLLHDNAMLMS